MTSPFKSRFVPTEYITIPRTVILALKEAAKNSDAGIEAGLLGLAIPSLINAVTNLPESGLGEGNVFVHFILNLVVGIVCLIFGLIMAYKAWEKRGKFNEQLREIDKMPLVQMNVSKGDTSISRVTSPSPNAHAGSGN